MKKASNPPLLSEESTATSRIARTRLACHLRESARVNQRRGGTHVVARRNLSADRVLHGERQQRGIGPRVLDDEVPAGLNRLEAEAERVSVDDVCLVVLDQSGVGWERRARFSHAREDGRESDEPCEGSLIDTTRSWSVICNQEVRRERSRERGRRAAEMMSNRLLREIQSSANCAERPTRAAYPGRTTSRTSVLKAAESHLTGEPG